MEAKSTPPRILRLPEVSARTGISKTQIYARMSAGTFPKQIAIGPRSIGWAESAINQFIEDCTRQTGGIYQ